MSSGTVHTLAGLARAETVNRMQLVLAMIFLIDHKVSLTVTCTGTRYRIKVSADQAGELRTAMGLYHARRSGIH